MPRKLVSKMMAFMAQALVLALVLAACGTPTPPAVTRIAKPTATIDPAVTPRPFSLVLAGQISAPSPTRLVWRTNSQSLGILTTGAVLLYRVKPVTKAAEYLLTEPTRAIDLSADGIALAITKDGLNVSLLDIFSGNVLKEFSATEEFTGGTFSPDTVTLALALKNRAAIDMWQARLGNLIRTFEGFETAEVIYRMQWTPDGQNITWLSENLVESQNIESWQLGTLYSDENDVNSAAVSKNNLFTAVAASGQLPGGGSGPTVRLYGESAEEPLAVFAVPNAANSAVFSADGRWLAVGAGRTIVVWDTSTLTQVTQLNAHNDDITALAFSLDGTYLASASKDGTVRLWAVR